MVRLPESGPQKKLEAAAQHWAAGDSSNVKLSEDLEAFGIVFEQSPEEEYFEVWPENWAAFTLFASLETQWRVEGMSGTYLGFDYAGVEAAMRMRGVKRQDKASLLADLQVMEQAARKVLNQRDG
jgi:hypothetical protein